MFRPKNSLEALPPATFVVSCFMLFARTYGASLDTNWKRFKFLFPLLAIGLLVYTFWGHLEEVEAIVGLVYAVAIWVTFDKKQNNLPDRIATILVRRLLRRDSKLTVFLVVLTRFHSPILPAPFIPPRAIA